MKAKLKIQDMVIFELACEVNDVKIIDYKKIGKDVIVIINYRTPSQIFELGRSEQSIMSNSFFEKNLNIKSDKVEEKGEKKEVESIKNNQKDNHGKK